jgi:predicted Zn finger-like uncharacterized protein
MRIVCPFCSAAYDVPENLIGGQRIVRCARCGQEWRPGPEEDEPEPAHSRPEHEPVAPSRPWSPEPEPPSFGPRETHQLAATAEKQPETRRVLAIERLMQPWEPDKPGIAVWLAWAASIGLVLFLIWAGYAWRGSVMHAWPASERLYAALGLH